MLNHPFIRIIVLIKIVILITIGSCRAAVYYVSPSGNNEDLGTLQNPWQTIQKAAEEMQPGDTCFIREGTYREWIKPARGGSGENMPIVYSSYRDEIPIIKCSEKITSWIDQGGSLWKTEISDSIFGSFNPFTINISGKYLEIGGEHHLGEVYFNEVSLYEVHLLEDVISSPNTWYTEHSGSTTTIYANFDGNDPNAGLAEINTREFAFFPEITDLNYITLNGLTFRHGASNWEEPNKSQYGMVGTWGGRSWIVQNCTFTDAKCAAFCSGYVLWGVDYWEVGHHLIRNNIFQRCGEAAICGQYGWYNSIIENNLIEDINYKQEFGGYETAGIKIHYAIDVTIRNNIIRRVRRVGASWYNYAGIWLDFCAQGSRISGNIICDIEDGKPIFLEADHGPNLIDNNIIMNGSIDLMSHRNIICHNLLFKSTSTYILDIVRESGYHRPHSTTWIAQANFSNHYGDRNYNNIYINTISGASDPTNSTDFYSDYNIYFDGAQKRSWDGANSIVNNSFATNFEFDDSENGVTINFDMNTLPSDIECPFINYDFIGKYSIVDMGIETSNGIPISIDKDILQERRNINHPTAGPFENLTIGNNVYTFEIKKDSLDETKNTHEKKIKDLRFKARIIRISKVNNMLLLLAQIHGEYTVEVISLKGETIKRFICSGNKNYLGQDQMANGIYALKLITNQGQKLYQRFIW